MVSGSGFRVYLLVMEEVVVLVGELLEVHLELHYLFFFFSTLVTGPRRSLSL